jgi:hypothetical protein
MAGALPFIKVEKEDTNYLYKVLTQEQTRYAKEKQTEQQKA